MSKISDIYEQIKSQQYQLVQTKFQESIKADKEKRELSDEEKKDLEFEDSEVAILVNLLKEQGFEDGKDFIRLRETGYPGDPNYTMLILKLKEGIASIFTQDWPGIQTRATTTSIEDLAMEIEQTFSDDIEEVINKVNNLTEMDIEQLQIRTPQTMVREGAVEAYKEKATEARENLVRAKLIATIEDVKAGNKKSREDNSLYQDNEIYVLLNMLEKAGLEEGVDYSYEEQPFDYNDTVPELHIRIGDNVLHFSGMSSVTSIATIEQIKEYIDDENEESIYSKISKLKPIDLGKLGIDIGELDLQISSVKEKESSKGMTIEDWLDYAREIGDMELYEMYLDQYYAEENDSRREEFEESLLREDVVEYYLSKTPEELEEEFGTEVSRMVGFEQKNAHHCYDLWQHTLHTVASIDTTGLTEEQAKKLKVAAFFHDIGKPDVVGFNPRTNQQNFINHAVHSVDIARPVLENLGYSTEEIQQISFYIAHHDDFLNYKGKVADKDKSHVFFRETTPSAVAEIVVQNQIDWEKLGIQCYLPTHTGDESVDKRNGSINSANNIKKRYICSALVNGVEPTFRDFKNQPIKVDVDMDDIRAKLATGEYSADYIPTEEDYRLLLEICKADARAQSEEVITVDPRTKREVVTDTRDRKVSTMQNIGEVIAVAYRDGTDKISETTKKEIEEATGYSFEQFIRDSIPQALGEKRPVVICKDGTEYSIQASSFHACSPRKDGLESYDEFEIYALENWDDLEDFMNYDGVAGNVPLAVVEQILKSHGGLDSEKMMARIQEQKGVYQPKSDAYEKMIRDASGGNEFLEKMLRYATRRCEVRDTNDKAKQLSEEYKAQLPKDPHSLDDNN